ncbi:hypothetical protein BB561_005237 [Smittium simulii]|uniref:40S ribosomal protein S17 n=1 Tax=Smittium simulii TaxID=133385 RepID=A0A2T9YBC8_9FUNG|nr:hypothetical protein BB561_005237 [Smittium simulii]
MIEKYYPKLTLDFQTNKRICDEVAIIPSKRLRNKIAGFTTHLMKRIQRGPVRGISFKLQEEERERKDNYVPDVSALDVEDVEIDPDTQDMIRLLNFENISGLSVTGAIVQAGTGRMDKRDFRRRDNRKPRAKKDPQAPPHFHNTICSKKILRTYMIVYHSHLANKGDPRDPAVPQVEQYKYLGLMFNNSWNHKSAVKNNADNTRKAISFFFENLRLSR